MFWGTCVVLIGQCIIEIAPSTYENMNMKMFGRGFFLIVSGLAPATLEIGLQIQLTIVILYLLGRTLHGSYFFSCIHVLRVLSWLNPAQIWFLPMICRSKICSTVGTIGTSSIRMIVISEHCSNCSYHSPTTTITTWYCYLSLPPLPPFLFLSINSHVLPVIITIFVEQHYLVTTWLLVIIAIWLWVKIL